MEEFDTQYHKDFRSYTGPCVGSTSIMQAILMNIKNIYLLGIDFAITKEGKSHSNAHALTKKQYNTQKLNDINSNISFRGDFFQVKGNFQESVYTNPLFYTSLESLNNRIPFLKNQQQNIYNLNNGAFIEGTTPLKPSLVQSLTTINKQALHKEITQTLMRYSAIELSSEDISRLQKKLKFAREIKKILLKYKKKSKDISKEKYLYGLISLILDILQEPTEEKANLIAVYDTYLSYSTPIIFDFFNTKDLTDIQKHIKNFDRLLVIGLLHICQFYEKKLEEFLK